jgi:hypothetical protein
LRGRSVRRNLAWIVEVAALLILLVFIFRGVNQGLGQLLE